VTPGYVVTSDGVVFEGRSVAAAGISTGELVFNTSMTGYQEILTDPSYAGQIVLMTASHIGNYGVSEADDQAGRPHAAGLVARSLSRMHSNTRAGGSLNSWLFEHHMVAVDGVDTRRLTRHIRRSGAMPAAIGGGVPGEAVVAAAAAAPSMEGRNLVAEVTTAESFVVEPSGLPRGRVVALDFGMKRDIVHRLAGEGLQVTVLPATATASEIEARRPDALFLSNGPGDPEPLTAHVEVVRDLLGRLPIFGICLGHQILGLALGARTYKLPFGHHGGNHPVVALEDGSVAITAQNHGFAVDLGSAIDGRADPIELEYGRVEPTHLNLNDGTLEGLRARDADAFSVQYHPEAAPGPRDAAALFKEFVRRLDR
jgi:carbamoyl-phosphate synthase small subunit